MRKQIFIIQVTEGLNSSIVQKMSSPNNLLLTDNIVNSKIFDSLTSANDFIKSLCKNYEHNKLISLKAIEAFLEVIL